MRSSLAVILLVPFLLAGSVNRIHAQQSLEARGEALLSRHCAMCHAIGRVGMSPHSTAPAFRTLGQRYPIESLQEALGEGLLSGHPDMPEFAFEPQDVGAIIRYLQSIQER
jgi:mono/diheme cytochrome c family protein